MADKKIGPTQEFPFGEPVVPGDRGGIYIGFRCLKDQRLCILEFGTSLSTLLSPIPEIRAICSQMQQRIESNWGKLGYNKAELPMRVSIVNDKLVQIVLPTTTEVLVCNPEVCLALAEVIEDRIAEAGLS